MATDFAMRKLKTVPVVAIIFMASAAACKRLGLRDRRAYSGCDPVGLTAWPDVAHQYGEAGHQRWRKALGSISLFPLTPHRGRWRP